MKRENFDLALKGSQSYFEQMESGDLMRSACENTPEGNAAFNEMERRIREVNAGSIQNRELRAVLIARPDLGERIGKLLQDKQSWLEWARRNDF